MRVWCVLLAGCTGAINGPCGAPIQVQAYPHDVVVLDDDRGALIESQEVPATGSVTFATPACTDSVTVLAPQYSDMELWALTVTDVSPGDQLDLVVPHYMPDSAPYDVTLDLQYPAFPASDPEMLFEAPGCRFYSSPVSCLERPKSLFARVVGYGSLDILGYALVPVAADPAAHYDALATIDAWRTDFASLPVDVANLRPGWGADTSVYFHVGHDTYGGSRAVTPGTITNIPRAGDGVTIWTTAVHGTIEDEDLVLDSFDALPASASVDVASVPHVDSVHADGPTSVSWTADAAPADVARACVYWTNPDLGWCVLSPPDRRSTTLPALPDSFAPASMPYATSVMMMETSRVSSYDDVRRNPIASLTLPFESMPFADAPEVRVRASRLGFVPDEPWWAF